MVLFFILCFILILFSAGMTGLLQNWVEKAVFFPPPAEMGGSLTGTARTALPAALYITILLGLSFSAHGKIPYPAAFGVMLILSLGLSTAASLGLSRLETLEVPLISLKSPRDLSRPGLILNTLSGEGRVPVEAGTFAQTVLLDGAGIISMPRQPLFYQEELAYQAQPSRLSFREENHPVLRGINADLEKSSQILASSFSAGLPVFAIYAGSLSVLLISLGCIVNISFWSLANLFFGALAFRGILALEALLGSGEIHNLLNSAVGSTIPPVLINPLIFCTLGVLILLYAGLVYLARGRRGE